MDDESQIPHTPEAHGPASCIGQICRSEMPGLSQRPEPFSDRPDPQEPSSAGSQQQSTSSVSTDNESVTDQV